VREVAAQRQRELTGPRRTARVVSALLRAALATTAAYRASFLVELLVSAGGALGVLLPIAFVYGHTQQVAGWTRDEAVLVTACFLVLQGLVGAVVEPNLGAVVDGIRTGQLDYVLLKPADAQLLASFQRFAPARLWDVLAGLFAGGWALARLPSPSPLQILAATAMGAAGIVAIYALWILVVCTSFWFVRVDNLRYLLGAVMDGGRWPASVYRGAARVLLTVVVPVAIATSWPPMALLGRLDTGAVVQAVVVSGALTWLSRWAWRRALGHYTSASS
jgi:ABC-2 type transport system permease protein